MDDIDRFFMIGFCSLAGCIVVCLCMTCFKKGCDVLNKKKINIEKIQSSFKKKIKLYPSWMKKPKMKK
jgi:hypothetical protein